MEKCSFVVKEEDVRTPVRPNFDGYECSRDTWRDGNCILHADIDDKSTDKIRSEIKTGDAIGVILRGLNFEDGLKIHGSDLFKSKIINCRFADSDLSKVDFTESIIENVSFDNSNLSESKFRHCVLKDTGFTECDLTGINFQEAEFEGVGLNVDSMNYSKFHGMDLTNIQLRGKSFKNSHFEGADLSGLKLTGCDFSGAILRGTDLRGTDFGGSNLVDVDFRGATICETHFGGTNLSKSVFYKCDLTTGGFGGSTLDGVNLESANLSGLDFSDLDMQGCNIADAECKGTNFHNANLKGSNLEGAVFQNVDLRRANLVNSMIFQTHFQNVRIDVETKFGKQSYYHSNGDLSKSVRVYRELQQLCRKNSLPNKRRELEIKEQDAKKDLSESKVFRGKAFLSNLIWRYGTSWKRVLITSFFVISGYSALYLYAGFVDTIEINRTFRLLGNTLTIPVIFVDVLSSIYLSIITFSTLGYGDVQPVGYITRFLAGSEALVGSLLMAAFIFVLGRRATW